MSTCTPFTSPATPWDCGRSWQGTLAGLATLGSGGPMGLEGPSMYAGAVVGSNLQRRLPRMFRDADRRVLLVAGAAAGVAAIFKAPATGAVFALEVPYQDDLARYMLPPGDGVERRGLPGLRRHQRDDATVPDRKGPST